jgi:hypothetical protein
MVDDTPLQAAEALNMARNIGTRDYIDVSVKGLRSLSDERLAALRSYIDMRFDEFRVWREQRTIYVESMLEARDKDILLQFSSRDKALTIQAVEYERRLDQANHNSERLHEIGLTYVRNDLYTKDVDRQREERRAQQAAYEKDLDRFREERREQQALSETFRVAQDIAEKSNRRSTLLSLVASAIAVTGIIATVCLQIVGHR